jgi:hypothetical protein
MHRQILGLEQGDSRLGDHINGNRLDNRRQNLRIVTKAQAAQNRKANATGLSGLRGVSFHKNRKVRPWMAEGSVNGQRYYLGYFDTAKEAGQVAKSFRDKFMQFAVDR